MGGDVGELFELLVGAGQFGGLDSQRLVQLHGPPARISRATNQEIINLNTKYTKKS